MGSMWPDKVDTATDRQRQLHSDCSTAQKSCRSFVTT